MQKQIKYKLIGYNLLVSIFMLIAINMLELREVFEIMFLYSLNSAIVFATLIYYEIKFFKGLNFNLLLLVAYCFRLVIPAITKSIDAINGIETYNLISVNVTTDYIFPTVVWMNIYYMIFYWCVLKFSKNFFIESSLKSLFSRFNAVYFAIPLFILGIAYNIIVSFVPAGVIPGIINTIFSNFVRLSLLMMLFDALFSQSHIKTKVFVVMIIIAMIQSAFWGFYKGAIMSNFVFYMLYYVLNRAYKKKRIVTPYLVFLGVSFFAIVYLIVYPFMQTKRVVSGWGPETGYVAIHDYSNLEILNDVFSGKAKFENTESGNRLDAIDANTFFYKDCCRYGWRSTELLVSNLELLVPRVLNPNKHNAEAGLMVSGYVFNGSFDYKDTAITNNYVGQFASAYLIGGPLCVIILAFFNGWFWTFYYNFLVKHNYNIIALILLMPFLFNALQGFEEIHDGGALNAGLNAAMMVLITLCTKVGLFNLRH